MKCSKCHSVCPFTAYFVTQKIHLVFQIRYTSYLYVHIYDLSYDAVLTIDNKSNLAIAFAFHFISSFNIALSYVTAVHAANHRNTTLKANMPHLADPLAAIHKRKLTSKSAKLHMHIWIQYKISSLLCKFRKWLVTIRSSRGQIDSFRGNFKEFWYFMPFRAA